MSTTPPSRSTPSGTTPPATGQPSTPTFGYTPGRATVAGLLSVLGAVMLAGGTGFAYAASTDVAESGYLTVVEETVPATGDSAEVCPDVVLAGGSR